MAITKVLKSFSQSFRLKNKKKLFQAESKKANDQYYSKYIK